MDEEKQHRTIQHAPRCLALGWSMTGLPTPAASQQIKRWQDYMGEIERRDVYSLWTPAIATPVTDPVSEPKPVTTQDSEHEIRYTDFPLDLEYDEVRQVEDMRLIGRLPYNVDGITSMARGERVRFEPGAFAGSLDGEIVLLAGNNYDDVLAANGSGGQLRFRDTPEALTFEARRLPKTRYAEDFAQKLQNGLVRGVTAGWALAGSETTSESLPDGGKRITVQKAMLCELRLRTRSAYPGESITARPRRRESARFQVV